MRTFERRDLPDDWMVDAACFGLDSDLFFSRDMDVKAAARRVCLSCSVRETCLDYAMRAGLNRDTDGIWGGLTPAQRRRVRRQHRLA